MACARPPWVRGVLGHCARTSQWEAAALLVLHGAEQRLDERAKRQPSHGIHVLCPASLVAEATDTRLVLGLESRCNTGLSYRLSRLYVCIHEVWPPLWHTPHCDACGTEAAQRPCIAVSHCQRSVTGGRTATIPRPSNNGRFCEGGVPALWLSMRCAQPS